MPHMHKCIFSLLTEQNECFQNSELTFIVYGENQSMLLTILTVQMIL